MGNESTYLVYSTEGRLKATAPHDSDIHYTIWRPSLTRIRVPTLDWKTSLLFWLCHQFRLFRSREYAVILVQCGSKIIHRTCLLPTFWRWPFMDRNDLQVSAVWTDPAYRTRGIATSVSLQAISTFARSDRRFWYITRSENYASIRVCTKAGFQLMGTAHRTRLLGLRLLGQFVVDSSTSRRDYFDPSIEQSIGFDAMESQQVDRAAA
jgi:RimJ/RimL family protein N-acetyltransferase